MTSASEPHPLRCETCGNHSNKSYIAGAGICLKSVKGYLTYSNNRGFTLEEFTADLGCASHTSAPAPAQERICTWVEDDDGVWNTECGNKFELISGEAPWRQKIKFCPYCGALLQAGERK